MSPRSRGIAFASGTAVISGVAIFLNARGVREAGDVTVYTTAKNLVAAGLLAALLVLRPGAGHRLARSGDDGRAAGWLPKGAVAGLVCIGIVGGSLPFVLFFEGLARESSVHAAFLQKTLVIWVALLAPVLLGERLRLGHGAAIALLVTGQAFADGGLGGFRFGSGEALILGATLLWSIEVILARRLLVWQVAPLALGTARMVLGSAVLIGWVAVSGRWSALTGLDARGWEWALLTGAILAGYVAGWFTALSLAPAVDVTAVLSTGAVVTAVLSAFDTGAVPPATQAGGLVMLVTGAMLVVVIASRARRAGVERAGAEEASA